jgi:tRNA nucleotidyltransferase (CCA-adding enzyme)
VNIREYEFILRPVLEEAREKKMRVCPVGGFVRDIMLNIKTDDFDFVVEGDTKDIAKEVFKKLKGKNFKYFPKFGTASFEFSEGRVDFARAREEFYPVPGKHPEIKFIDKIELDLKRRDFSINAMALEIDDGTNVRIIDLFDGLKDIKEKKIRVLHLGSISDDPTRILRAIRLKLKLKFEISKETLESLEIAKENQSFKNVSGDRYWSEIKIASRENLLYEFIIELDKLSVLFSINPELSLSSKEIEKLGKMKNMPPDEKLAEFLTIYFERSPYTGYEIMNFFKVSKTLEKLTLEKLKS